MTMCNLQKLTLKCYIYRVY